MTVADIIEKRKARWAEKHEVAFDKTLTDAAAVKILSDRELQKEVLEKPYLLIEAVMYIVDKKRRTVPFFLNEVQKDFIRVMEEKGTVRPFFVLKGRQQGFTSLITAMQLAYAIVRKNFSGFTMCHRADSTRAIFNDKAKASYDRLPQMLKPTEKYNNSYELSFSKLGSAWRVATAGDGVGRGLTLNFVHFSEVAFYDCSLSFIQSSIGEAIADGAFVIYETTANGFNEAKALWDSGSCENVFYGWWRTGEYRSKQFGYIERADAWLTERVKTLEEMGLDREQIAWYCKKYDSYIDKSLIKQEYPITPEEAFVATGSSVFDNEILTAQMMRAAKENPKRGRFVYRKSVETVEDSNGNAVDTKWRIEDIRWKDCEDGEILIYEEPIREVGKNGTKLAPYVIGGDTAGTGIDYFTAKVVCNLNHKCVATYRKQYVDEDLYAEQMYCLGRYYNDALIGIEINFSRHPMRVLSNKFDYPNLYARQTVDHMTDNVVMDFGFQTTKITKPIIIGELVSLMRDDATVEPDLETLREMTTFVKLENGSMGAMEGSHDDLVMASAIAHFICNQQTTAFIEVEPEEDSFAKDFIRDNFRDVRVEDGGNADFMSWEDL